MNRLVLALVLFLLATPAWAIQNGSGFQTTNPTNAQVPNWTTGWGAPGITGWNYVGQINSASASGTYLGNGWVLTAGHIGAGDFTLAGKTYAAIPGSSRTITQGSDTADLAIFQINTLSNDNSTYLSLPPLLIRPTDPVAFAYGTTGSSVVMMGYGGGKGETWGLNTVTQINQSITPSGFTYVSNDFLTLTGVTTYNNPHGPGSQSITNNAQVVTGDSGGGDFIYNSSNGQWYLAGINEVSGTDSQGQALSGFVQLNTYTAQLNAIYTLPTMTDTPTMPLWGIVILAGLLVCAGATSLTIRSPQTR